MWNKYRKNETMKIISGFCIYKTMYHNGKKENDKVLEFHLNNSSYFEISAFLYVAPLTLKIN